MPHTPAPWTAHKRLHYAWTLTAHGEVIGEFTDTRTGRIENPELDANARLMGAAPELLEACKEALLWSGPDGDHISDPARSLLLAAISKATQP